jgi:glucose-1-phosphate thymidylyltransferase
MKGILLAGGTGSRLWPLTRSTSKQLLPIYDKPMIYYPLSTLMLAGIREILVITTRIDQANYKKLLGDGSKLGISLDYLIQSEPKGLAEAFIIGEKFIADKEVTMILGDNLFYGVGLGTHLSRIQFDGGCRIFISSVANPENYGVLEFDNQDKPLSIIEKPRNPNSSWAVTGLYMFDSQVVEIAKSVKPSARGELEITSVIEHYLTTQQLKFSKLGRGDTWLDTGTPSSLIDASNFVKTIEDRTGLKVACLEEIAWTNGWIDSNQLGRLASEVGPEYREYLLKLIGP